MKLVIVQGVFQREWLLQDRALGYGIMGPSVQKGLLSQEWISERDVKWMSKKKHLGVEVVSVRHPCLSDSLKLLLMTEQLAPHF